MHVSTPYSFAIACLISSGLVATPARAADLDIKVTDVRAQQGSLRVAVIDSAGGWADGGKPVAGTVGKAQGPEQTFHFPDLPPGRYAVMVMHDQNDNGKLDSNFMGMPIEGYGFSNNPAVRRKPSFEEAGFELGAAGSSITVRLR
jgi:uncharacterized protein (DUF2141 family)